MNSEARVPERYQGILDVLTECVDEVFTTMIATVAELVSKEEHSLAHSEELPVEGLSGERRVAFEAVVEFSGPATGAVILRVSPDGATDIARGLLMLEAGDPVEVDEIKDALGECANMVSGSLKCKALDPTGEFTLGVPTIDARVDYDKAEPRGSLLYRLAEGCTAVEVWMKEAADAA